MNEIKIKLPENTTAELSIENGFAVLEFIPEKKELETGKWHVDGDAIVLCLDPMKDSDAYFKANGFFCGVWYNEESISQRWEKNHDWKPADMKEVTRLLIGEAEKRGFKEGVMFIPPSGMGLFNVTGKLGMTKYALVDSMNNTIFSFKTGKWAEIVKEKKPIYTNCYKREYFGDETGFWFLRNDGTTVYSAGGLFKDSAIGLGLTNSVAFYGTERECHRYLDENWDELNK